MKKMISFLLVLSLVMLCCMVPFAANTSKITAATEQKISETPAGEKFQVTVWIRTRLYTSEEIKEMVRKELGWEWWLENWGHNPSLDAVHEYSDVYNRIASELESGENRKFVEESGIPEEDIVYISTKAPMILIMADADTIYRLAQMEKVKSISYEGSAEIVDATATPTEGWYTEAPTQAPTGETKAPTEPPTQAPTKSKDFYFEAVFGGWCQICGVEKQFYQELYSHKNEAGIPDWVLVYGYSDKTNPNGAYAVVGNRVLMTAECDVPFGTRYGVLDIQQGFKDICSIDISAYDGLEEIFNELGGGRLLGDVDSDNEITIIDATFIQRCEAQMTPYPESDDIVLYEPAEGALKYYSDFDRDGERDILDATSIQRYLVGLPYYVNK